MDKTQIAKELGRLVTDGRLLPEDVVIAAANPSNAMHDHFTWDDTEAAQKQRISEARVLIRSVRVEVTSSVGQFAVPVYLAGGEKSGAYIQTATIRDDADASRDAILREMERVRNALDRARRISAVLGTQTDIDAIIAIVDRFIHPDARA